MQIERLLPIYSCLNCAKDSKKKDTSSIKFISKYAITNEMKWTKTS